MRNKTASKFMFLYCIYPDDSGALANIYLWITEKKKHLNVIFKDHLIGNFSAQDKQTELHECL